MPTKMIPNPAKFVQAQSFRLLSCILLPTMTLNHSNPYWGTYTLPKSQWTQAVNAWSWYPQLPESHLSSHSNIFYGLTDKTRQWSDLGQKDMTDLMEVVSRILVRWGKDRYIEVDWEEEEEEKKTRGEIERGRRRGGIILKKRKRGVMCFRDAFMITVSTLCRRDRVGLEKEPDHHLLATRLCPVHQAPP